MKRLLASVWLTASTLVMAMAADRVVAHLDGQAVRESRLVGTSEQQRADHLHALVVGPAIAAYLRPHEARFQPTDEEIARFLQVLRAHSACHGRPDPPSSARHMAETMVRHLKLQRFLYERHGGGRVRFQQTGREAFDATRHMILMLESQGRFAIHDAGLRARALGYWLEPGGPLEPDPGPARAFTFEDGMEPCPRR